MAVETAEEKSHKEREEGERETDRLTDRQKDALLPVRSPPSSTVSCAHSRD